MATDTTEAVDTGSAVPGPQPRGSKRRMRAPKFALAIPAWTWFIVFFGVPVGLVLLYSLGEQVSTFVQKPNISPSVWSAQHRGDRSGSRSNVMPLRRRCGKRKGEGDTTLSQGKRAARGTSAGGQSHSVWKLEWKGRYATKLTLVRI